MNIDELRDKLNLNKLDGNKKNGIYNQPVPFTTREFMKASNGWKIRW
jgi:hypothetical protein